MNKRKSVTPTRKRHQSINSIKRKLQLSGEILEKNHSQAWMLYTKKILELDVYLHLVNDVSSLHS
jgi:hypothetical protein